MPPRRNPRVVGLEREWLEQFPDLPIPAMTTDAEIAHVDQMLLEAAADPSYRPQVVAPGSSRKRRWSSPEHVSAVSAYNDLRVRNSTSLMAPLPTLTALRERDPGDWTARFYRWVLPRVEEATALVREEEIPETTYRVFEQALTDLPEDGPASLQNAQHIKDSLSMVRDTLGLYEAQRLLRTREAQAITGLQTAARLRDLELVAQHRADYRRAVINAGAAQQRVEEHNQALMDQYLANRTNVELERDRSWFRSSVPSPVYPALLGDIPAVPVPRGVSPVKEGDMLIPTLHRLQHVAPSTATKNQVRTHWRDTDVAYRRAHHLPPPPPPGAGGSSLI